MKPTDPIKLVSELLDLPVQDSEGRYCGIVDDAEFAGTKELTLKALLVGPGAYAGRLPRWATWLVKRIAGDRITRVPIDKVRTIRTMVSLDCPASELGLNKSEAAAGRWIPRKGAL